MLQEKLSKLSIKYNNAYKKLDDIDTEIANLARPKIKRLIKTKKFEKAKIFIGQSLPNCASSVLLMRMVLLAETPHKEK